MRRTRRIESGLAEEIFRDVQVAIHLVRRDMVELETVGFHDRGEVFQIARAGELVDRAQGIRRVVDDVPGWRFDRT